jgi:uridine kinase
MKTLLKKSLFIFVMFLPIASKTQPHSQKSNKPGMIILLNGTSSAGKTTLSQALHAIYENYEVAHIDNYTRRHNHGSFKTKSHGFYTEIKDVALAGQNIIVDTILYHDHYAAYDNLLTNRDQKNKPIKLIKILVYCSIDSIVDHVRKRNQLSNSLDHRTVHQAFIGFLSLYTIKNATRATMIDTIDSIQTKIALQKAMSTIHPQAHKYLKRLAKINQKIIHHLNLNKVEKIKICPQHEWDLIVNTSNQTPEQVAQQIADFIESKR